MKFTDQAFREGKLLRKLKLELKTRVSAHSFAIRRSLLALSSEAQETGGKVYLLISITNINHGVAAYVDGNIGKKAVDVRWGSAAKKNQIHIEDIIQLLTKQEYREYIQTEQQNGVLLDIAAAEKAAAVNR